MDWHRGSLQTLPYSAVKNLWREIDPWHYNYERIRKVSTQCLSRPLSLLLFVMFCTSCSCWGFFCILFKVKSLRCINARAKMGQAGAPHLVWDVCCLRDLRNFLGKLERLEGHNGRLQTPLWMWEGKKKRWGELRPQEVHWVPLDQD